MNIICVAVTRSNPRIEDSKAGVELLQCHADLRFEVGTAGAGVVEHMHWMRQECAATGCGRPICARGRDAPAESFSWCATRWPMSQLGSEW